jgi:hypothetical protein
MFPICYGVGHFLIFVLSDLTFSFFFLFNPLNLSKIKYDTVEYHGRRALCVFFCFKSKGVSLIQFERIILKNWPQLYRYQLRYKWMKFVDHQD